jgi:hypothetical protein
MIRSAGCAETLKSSSPSSAALALVIGYGVAIGRYRNFPHEVIDAAADSARDWKEHWRRFLGCGRNN